MSAFPPGGTILWHIKGTEAHAHAPPPLPHPSPCAHVHALTEGGGGECRTFAAEFIRENRIQTRKYSLSIAGVSFAPAVRLRERRKAAAHVDSHYLSGAPFRLDPCVLHKWQQMRKKTTSTFYFFCLLFLAVAPQQQVGSWNVASFQQTNTADLNLSSTFSKPSLICST